MWKWLILAVSTGLEWLSHLCNGLYPGMRQWCLLMVSEATPCPHLWLLDPL